jgi:type IV pilus assembly protein PilV
MNTQSKKTNSFSQRKQQKGLTLIEVLVTVVISSIGLMGLVALQLRSIEATSDAGNRSQAIWLFNDIVNRIHANEVSSSSYLTADPYVCPAAAPPACTTYHTGALRVVSANCDATQMAAWDLFEIACGSPKADGFFGNSVTYLPTARLSISCADAAACGNGAALIVEFKWQARLDTESITGNARTATSGELILSDIITP